MYRHDESAHHKLANIVCNKQFETSFNDCYNFCREHNSPCKEYGKCRIKEKSEEQIDYILDNIDQNIFLEACPGSGKTETVGLKAAYEIKKWDEKNSGIAVLTFTNNATDVIKDRVKQFAYKSGISHPHYIGTIDSWLLGYIVNPFSYIITKPNLETDDLSIKIIDKNQKGGFLERYKSKTPYLTQNDKQIPIYANQIIYDIDKTIWINVPFSNKKIKLEDYYHSSQFKKFKSDKEFLTYDYVKDQMELLKDNFLKNQFATYEDIKYICYKILLDKKIGKLIAKRFPIIIIDECQDLSIVEIELFILLTKYGCNIHLIGDLDQSINTFKNSIPEYIDKHPEISQFHKYSLSRNFRSVQNIVDTCSNIIKSGKSLKGEENDSKIEHCILFNYEKNTLDKLPDLFSTYIQKNHQNYLNIAIFTRSNDLLEEISFKKSKDAIKEDYLIASSIYEWNSNFLNLKKDVILKVGKFLSKRLFENHYSNKNYFFCPDGISTIQWRIFLANIMNECCKTPELTNMEMTWEKYRKNFDEIFPEVLKKLSKTYDWVPSDNLKNACLKRTPQGKSKIKVKDTIDMINKNNKENLTIETIHSSKGKTYDGILLISKPDAKGQTNISGSGYWQHWLDIYHESGESSRLAYVASSRPKYLLAWAIPEKDYNHENLKKLQVIGFKPIDTLSLYDQNGEQMSLFDPNFR